MLWAGGCPAGYATHATRTAGPFFLDPLESWTARALRHAVQQCRHCVEDDPDCGLPPTMKAGEGKFIHVKVQRTH